MFLLSFLAKLTGFCFKQICFVARSLAEVVLRQFLLPGPVERVLEPGA